MARSKYSDFKIGEEVAYSSAFLKSVGGHGEMAARRGKLVSMETSAHPALAKVIWNDDPARAPKSVLVVNIRPPRTFHLEM